MATVNAEMMGRRVHRELVEEDRRYAGVEVLARMHDHLLDMLDGAHRARDRARLDELGRAPSTVTIFMFRLPERRVRPGPRAATSAAAWAIAPTAPAHRRTLAERADGHVRGNSWPRRSVPRDHDAPIRVPDSTVDTPCHDEAIRHSG
jgi:hypothetical protein